MNLINDFYSKYYNLIESNFHKVFDLDHFYLFFLLTLLAFLIDLIYSGWKKSSFRQLVKFEKSTQVDFFSWLIETINIFSLISLLLSFGTCYYLVGLIQKSIDFNFTIKNVELQFIVIFIISDLKGWFSHYIFHASNSLWQLHSFHHSATNFNILTRQRGHFLEAEIKRFFDVIPFVLFGAPISSYFFVKAFVEIHQMIIHSSSNSDWGFIGKYILVSPAAHKIHHSINPKHYNKNFGGTFIFWDRLFRTYHPKEENVKLGIPDNPFNKGYINDILLCQWLFIKNSFFWFRKIFNPFKNNTTNKT